jgi:Flp pilus assembly protein TadG
MSIQDHRRGRRDRGFGSLRSRGRALVRRLGGRRGTVLVLTTLLMVAVIGMLAFAIDLGYIVHARTALQRTADASALAAAALLPHQSTAEAVARAVATENGWSSGVGSGDEWNGSDLDPMTVEFGFWDRDAATFTSPGRRTNAVRVTLRRSEATKNPLRLFFARVLNNAVADVSASATAWGDHGVCGPFVGIDSLDVGGGANTDSYDSQAGAYSSATAGDRGSICSDGPVDVSGSSIVRGDALAGMDDPPPDISTNATVTGYDGNRITPLTLPPVDATAAALHNDNSTAPPIWQGNGWRNPIGANGDFSLNAGEIYTLPSGTYYLRNFTINGGATLIIDPHNGPVKIYVTGTYRREGGALINNTHLAKNLQILCTGSTVTVTSTNDFYGVVYAPQADVTLNGDSDLFGAVVGRTLKINGSGYAHYDESLDLEYLDIAPRTMLVD